MSQIQTLKSSKSNSTTTSLSYSHPYLHAQLLLISLNKSTALDSKYKGIPLFWFLSWRKVIYQTVDMANLLFRGRHHLYHSELHLSASAGSRWLDWIIWIANLTPLARVPFTEMHQPKGCANWEIFFFLLGQINLILICNKRLQTMKG